MLRDSWLKWFERRIQVGQSLRRAQRTTRRRLASKRTQATAAWVAQELEQRTLLTTFTVDTLVDESDGNIDPGEVSLREAIEQANANPGADTIQFADGLQGGIINLTLGTLNVTDDLTVVGTNNPILLKSNGLVLQAAGPGSTLAFSMTGVGVNGTDTGPGLLIDSTDDAVVNVTIANSFFNNAAEEGIKINADTGGTARLTLTDASVNSNGEVTLSAGISVDVGVAAQAESTNTPGQFAFVSLNMSDVDVQNNALEGLDVTARSGGKYQTTTSISNVQFVGNGGASARNEVDLNASGAGSSIVGRFDMVNADGSKASGFNLVATAGGNVAAVISNSSANNTLADAIAVRADGPGSAVALSVDNFAGDNAGSSGAEFNVTNGGQVRVNNFNNVSMQNAGWSGIDVNLIGGEITAFNGSNVNVSGSQMTGLDLFLRSGAGTFTIDGLTSDNNVDGGVKVFSIVGATTSVTLNNVSLVGNQTKQPIWAIAVTDASLDLNVNGGTLSSAGTNPNSSVFLSIDNNAVGNLSFTDVTVNNSTSSAFSVRYDRAAMGNLNIANTIATGSASVGLALFVTNGSQVTGNFDGLDVSGSGAGLPADGVRIDVTGPGSMGEFMFNNVTANAASRRGIAFLYANEATGAVTKFDNVSAQGAQEDGLAILVRGNSQLTSFTGNGVNLTNAGQSGNLSFDALDLIVQEAGTTASVNIQNLTADFAAGRAINLSVLTGAVADVVIDGFSGNNSGLEGLNLTVGTVIAGAALQNTTFRNGSFSNNGAGGSSNGIRATVTGAGSSADITLDNVSADSNSRNGVEATVNAGGDLTLGIENGSTANNNFLAGVRFRVDGKNTTAALTSTVAGSSFSGNNDTGLIALLTGEATISEITVLGGASNNGNNGVHIDARPDVTLNSLTVGGAGTTFASNEETGLLVELDGVLELSSVVIDGVTATGNLGVATGINVQLANLTLDDVALTNISTQNNTGDGLTLVLDDVTVNNNLGITGFNMAGNGGDGVDANLINGTIVTGTVNLDGNSGGNSGDGIKVIANDASGVSIGTFAVSGANLAVNGNIGNGLTVDFDTVSGIASFDLSGMVITNNEGDQASVRFANMVDPIAISFDDATATGPGGGAVGDGIDLTIDNTTATSLNLNRINASSNGGDGLKLTLLNGATIPSTSIDVGTFDNNGANGIGINITSSTAEIDITNSTFDLLGTVASASFNGGNGISVRMDDADLTMNTVDRLTIDGNMGAGIDIQAATPSTFTSGSSFTNNTIINNGSFGYRAIFNGGTFDIAIGSRTTPGQGNLFDNNTGAGIVLEMIQDSAGRMGIFDNTITNTNTNAGPGVFNGDGIIVRMLGTANPAQATNTLTDDGVAPGLLIRDNIIGGTGAGNAGTGIDFQVEEESVIDGLDVLTNSANSNGVDGLNFRRFDTVTIDRFRVVNNTFNGNADDGVEIVAQNDDATAMDVTITGNEMNDNGDNGTALQVNADAKLDIDVQSNSMTGNGDDGLDMTEIALAVEDSRAIFGDIGFNTMSDNGNRGVNAGAFMGTSAVVRLLIHDNIIGAQFDQFGQVTTDGNGSTGIDLTGGGFSTWTNNDIIRNGRLVIADREVGHGIDISDDFFGFYNKDIVLDSNLIRENFQDGIEFNNAGLSSDPNFDFFSGPNFTMEMIDNRVQNNLGRGIDILNQRLAESFITIRSSDPSDPTKGNFINSNGEEGIYAVNTASATQTQDGFASETLASNGGVAGVNPELSLVIDNSTVSNNGDPVNVAGMVQSAGIVVRVGSAGQGRLFGDSSFDFATSFFGPNSGFVPPAVVSGPVEPVFVNPGVYLQVTNSTMQGNFGDDAFLHGFTSTVNPGQITGTWSDTEFDPNFNFNNSNGPGDPLARLDVFWGTAAAGNGNVFDSVEVNNQFALGIPSTPKGEAGAYYDNADGTFKSRISTATPPGPFGMDQAARRRNAQRVAERRYPGGFTLSPDPGPALQDGDNYGRSVAGIGDLDFDGVSELVIGAPGDGFGTGALYVQFLNDDGSVKRTTEISPGLGGAPPLAFGDQFGVSVAALGDLNGDGIGDIAVGANLDDTGGADRGAVYILFLDFDGTVKSSTKIDSNTAGMPVLDDGDEFGISLASLGDLDGAGTSEIALAIGATGDDTGGVNRGAVHVLFLDVVGTTVTIDSTATIADGSGGLALMDGDAFGSSLASPNIGKLFVGAALDDTGGLDIGAVYLMDVNATGGVIGFTKIDSTTVGAPVLGGGDRFGTSVAAIGDLDSNGFEDLLVGTPGDDTEGTNRGSTYVLLMGLGNTIDTAVQIASNTGGGPDDLSNGDGFGSSVTLLGDLDSDGTIEVGIGAAFDDAGGTNRGAVQILSLANDGMATVVDRLDSNTGSPDNGFFLFPGMGDSTFRTFAGGDTTIAAELASIGFLFDDDPVGGDFAPIESPNDINGTHFSPGIGGRAFGWGTY